LSKSILFVIRHFFALASHLAPKLAGRLAFRLFCTTFPPASKSAKHQAILLKAQHLFDTANRHAVSYSGGTVVAFEFLPDNANAIDHLGTVWLVHGWQSHSMYMSEFIAPFLQRGYRVVSVDLPGHGQSSGRTFHLPLAVGALNAVVEKFATLDKPAKLNLVVSHSLGGAVVATTLAGTLSDQPAHIAERLVLISAPDSMRRLFDEFAAMITLSPKSTEELHAIVTRMTGRVTEDFSTGLQLQQGSAELLLIHAPEDKEVAYSEAEAVLRLNPAATLKPMPGLGHRRIIASDKVVKTAIDFITT